MKDLKYLAAYFIPFVVFISIYLEGMASFFAIAMVFVILPLIEFFLPGNRENPTSLEEEGLKKRRLFDWLLYANLPIQYGILGYFLYKVTYVDLELYELIGMTFAMGVTCGVLGINVAHELGHRPKKYEQWMAQALLLTSMYMHFFIEHNRGHHKNVATPKDPATALRGQTVYAFWWQSVTGAYMSAWRLEVSRLEKQKKSFWSWDNQMLKFQAIQLLFVLLIGVTLGSVALIAFLGAALVGILELETVNYLEHYGLLRKQVKEGVYERVQPYHSWNTNRTLGRIMLYELTRHSDHHYLASRKYQVLRHFDESPELPTGYPAMMVLSLFPPLWFKVMNKQLSSWEKRFGEKQLAMSN